MLQLELIRLILSLSGEELEQVHQKVHAEVDYDPQEDSFVPQEMFPETTTPIPYTELPEVHPYEHEPNAAAVREAALEVGGAWADMDMTLEELIADI